MTWHLLHGNCRELMAEMPDASVDAIVTDPPYGLSREPNAAEVLTHWLAGDDYQHRGNGFMGNSWDSFVPGPATWREALRVLKPGGFLLAFFGSRTYDLGTIAIRLAGFEVRDMVEWLYGSGFPKGGNRDGKGTCLKPAHEPIVMARKPCIGSAKANLAAFGTGALDIDACRVAAESGDEPVSWTTPRGGIWTTSSEATGFLQQTGLGRWPANVIHDGSDEVVALFPDAPGQLRASRDDQRTQGAVYGATTSDGGRVHEPRADKGSAARFFMSTSWSDEEWLAQNLRLSPADIAAFPSPLRSALACIVRSDAVTSALPEAMSLSVASAPSTNVTANELKWLAETLITVILHIANESWREWPHTELTVTTMHAVCVARRTATGTTLTIRGLSMLYGSADPVTFNITPENSEAGARDSPARFRYCAKASKADRDEGLDQFAPQAFVQFQTGNGESGEASSLSAGRGTQYRNIHPTVKPEALMRYLVRLVTPKGGTVLDPFAGSGSTGKAAILEGRSFVGCELTAEYLPIAEARLCAAASRFAAEQAAAAPGPQRDLFATQAA